MHESRAITDQTPLNVLRRLHALVVWAAYTYSTKPDQVPTSTAYDPSRIPAPTDAGAQAALTTAELNQLLASFEAKDDEDVDRMIVILDTVRAHAAPADSVA